MFYFFLLQYAEYSVSVWRIIYIAAGEELVHKVLHLVVAQHLSVGYGGITGQAKGQSLAYIGLCGGASLNRRTYHIAHQAHRVEPIQTGGYAFDCVASITQIRQFEAHAFRIGQYFLQHHLL